MMISAKLKHLRIAPRKIRLIADLIRGKSFENAQIILNFTNKKGASNLLNLLNQAVANAENNFQLEKSNLWISKIIVDEGPKLKRWLPRARGKADRLEKKTSHITMVLDEINKTKGGNMKEAAKKNIKEEGGKKALSKKENSSAKKSTKESIFKVKRADIKAGAKKVFRRKEF